MSGQPNVILPVVGTAQRLKWSWDLQLRAKDASGAVLSTYQPAPFGGLSIDTAPEYKTKDVEFTDTGRKKQRVHGHWLHVLVHLEVVSGTWDPADGFADLDSVLSAYMGAGVSASLELSLDGGTTWKEVDLLDDSGSAKVDTMNTAMGRDLEFRVCELSATIYSPGSGAW